MRAEQVVIYALAAGATLFVGTRMSTPRGLGMATLAWLLIGLLAAINTNAIGAFNQAAVAGLDAVLLPLATVIAASAIPKESRWDALRLVAVLVVLAGVANSGMSWLQSTGRAPGILAEWLPASEESSGARAALQGRWTGFLNQPALAGCFYGLALLLATWRFRNRLVLIAVWALLISGGLLSGSKAFLWVGLPIALMYLIVVRFGRGFFVATGMAAGIVLVGVWAEGVVGQGFVGEVTGNRYGTPGSTGSVMDRAQQSLSDDMLGHGLAGTGSATDSQWVMAIDFAGLPGILFLAGVILSLWAALRFIKEPTLLPFCAAVIGLISVASFAFPLLSGNRIGPLLWLTLVLALSAQKPPPQAPPPSARERRKARREEARTAHLRRFSDQVEQQMARRSARM